MRLLFISLGHGLVVLAVLRDMEKMVAIQRWVEIVGLQLKAVRGRRI
jgi:hypothetical protein